MFYAFQNRSIGCQWDTFRRRKKVTFEPKTSDNDLDNENDINKCKDKDWVKNQRKIKYLIFLHFDQQFINISINSINIIKLSVKTQQGITKAINC